MKKLVLGLFILILTLILVACSSRQRINSDEAYLLQTYGSPDGEWIVASIAPQMILRNLITNESIETHFRINLNEYPVFASWSPDGSAFLIFEASYRLGCPLQRLAIYNFENPFVNREVYEPDYILDDGGCMRAVWSPDSQSIALMLGPQIVILDRNGGVIKELRMVSDVIGSSIQSFAWIDAGILYTEKISFNDPYGILHYVNIESGEHKMLYRSQNDLVLAGAQGKYALVISSFPMFGQSAIDFVTVDVVDGKIINTFAANNGEGRYCGSLSSTATTVAVLAFGSGEKCSFSVLAFTVNFSDATSMEGHGEIFGLVRWDANTSSFVVLRGTEADGLWLDSITP